MQFLPNPNNRGKIMSDKTGSEGWISEVRRCRQGEDLRVNWWSQMKRQRGGSCWSQTERAPVPVRETLGRCWVLPAPLPGQRPAEHDQHHLYSSFCCTMTSTICTLHFAARDVHSALTRRPVFAATASPW